jgi:hypothetical protein
VYEVSLRAFASPKDVPYTPLVDAERLQVRSGAQTLAWNIGQEALFPYQKNNLLDMVI